MKKSFFLIIILLVASCNGVRNDAREVCKCYEEVVHSADSLADHKMQECMDLYNKYLVKYQGTGNYEYFLEEHDKCR